MSFRSPGTEEKISQLSHRTLRKSDENRKAQISIENRWEFIRLGDE